MSYTVASAAAEFLTVGKTLTNLNPSASLTAAQEETFRDALATIRGVVRACARAQERPREASR